MKKELRTPKMTITEKIQIDPVPEGFIKKAGRSVEDVLEILQAKEIDRLLCHPDKGVGDFRRHVIILTRSDYGRLMQEGDFGEVKTSGGGFSYAGLYARATYQGSPCKDSDAEEFAIEDTQLRLFNPMIAPQDWDFIEVNGIRASEAMKPFGYKQ